MKPSLPQEHRDTHAAGRRTSEGVMFQDSQELVVKGCENNTEAKAVREIVNRGINETVKWASEPTPTTKPLHRGMSVWDNTLLIPSHTLFGSLHASVNLFLLRNGEKRKVMFKISFRTVWPVLMTFYTKM